MFEEKRGTRILEDAKIVELYFDRDEAAVAETAVKYGSYCHTVSYNVLRDAEDAEECVNDTWLHTWNAIPPTRPDSLKAFVGRIARNLSLNRLKEKNALKRGAGEADAALEELDEFIASGATVEDEVEGRLLKDEINRFLGGLSRNMRVAFVQRYFYFSTVKEIAANLGLTENNVKSLLFRTRNKLKEHLEKEGFVL